ncbi:CwfJ C-terminus 1-domain-containing protein-like protein [Sphaerosporella brunnea]|uniref:CwfJ C-terminus 1-domain-containing protein-like protein n=1 Tax=Sphaerosporella brunnea TaxID=1250544 RepID=A0A5J5ERB2_9PEZI|nr:CwfJ C-terminus 1-domain-containing protein-like protein [Sphaerosporella brunnea]
MASKIVVVGALRGRFAEIFPKLAALHAKNSFSFALLLGDVFASPDSTADSLIVDQLLRGEVAVPLPTYFTLGTDELPPAIAERIATHGGEVCENLFFLGKKGSIKTAEGIRIVTVGGSWDPNIIAAPAVGKEETQSLPFYSSAEVNALKGQNYADILVTTDWPAGVERHSAIAPQTGQGSKPIAELACALRPRYHFVPGGDTYYEREPYRNELRKGESGESKTTRFYALGDWGNDAKAKAMFAFSINVSEPPAAAPNRTLCPYVEDSQRGTKRPAEEGTFFWGDHTSRPERHHHKRRHHKEQRPPPGPESCFFCLSYPQLEKHLIVSIGSESYLTTAKGPLTSKDTNTEGLQFSGHILIIPFAHTPTIPLIEDPDSKRDTIAEMNRYKEALEKLFESCGAGSVTFEVRRQSGVHAHWQVVPLKPELLEDVDAAFDSAAKQAMNREFEDEADTEEGEVGDAFTYWASGKKKGRSLKLHGNEYFDLQFGRRVLAGIIGVGGRRANWRDCVMTTAEESTDASAFKAAFKSFDFSLEE